MGLSNASGFDRGTAPVNTISGTLTIASGAAVSNSVALGSSFANGSAIGSYVGAPDAAGLGFSIDASGNVQATLTGNATAERTVRYIAFAKAGQFTP